MDVIVIAAELDHSSHTSWIVSLKVARIRDTEIPTDGPDIWNGLIQLWVLQDLTRTMMTQNSILVDAV